MDEQLKELIALAAARDSKYIKGETTISELPEKIAELNEIQQKIDDLRKAIFSNKLKVKKP